MAEGPLTPGSPTLSELVKRIIYVDRTNFRSTEVWESGRKEIIKEHGKVYYIPYLYETVRSCILAWDEGGSMCREERCLATVWLMSDRDLYR